MDDPLLVRGFERLGNLLRDGEGPVDGQPDGARTIVASGIGTTGPRRLQVLTTVEWA